MQQEQQQTASSASTSIKLDLIGRTLRRLAKPVSIITAKDCKCRALKRILRKQDELEKQRKQ